MLHHLELRELRLTSKREIIKMTITDIFFLLTPTTKLSKPIMMSSYLEAF
jgi:hypothetical protein